MNKKPTLKSASTLSKSPLIPRSLSSKPVLKSLSKRTASPFTSKPKLPKKLERFPKIILVCQGYEIANGMSGMKRDVVVRLCSVLWHKTDEVRAIIGMSGEHCQWKSHSFFLKGRPPNILVTFRPDPKASCSFDETVAIIGTKIRFNLERDALAFLDKILIEGVTLRLNHYSTKVYASYRIGIAFTENLSHYYKKGFREGHFRLKVDMSTGRLTTPCLFNILTSPYTYCNANTVTWSMPAPVSASVEKAKAGELKGKEKEDGGVLITAEINTYADTLTFIVNGEPAPYGVAWLHTGRRPFLFGIHAAISRQGEKSPDEHASVSSLLFCRMPVLPVSVCLRKDDQKEKVKVKVEGKGKKINKKKAKKTNDWTIYTDKKPKIEFYSSHIAEDQHWPESGTGTGSGVGSGLGTKKVEDGQIVKRKKAVLAWPNPQCRYEGEVRMQQPTVPDGQGVLTCESGIYAGEWVNGKREGKGSFASWGTGRIHYGWAKEWVVGRYENQDMFTGEWKDDAKNGKGVFECEGGAWNTTKNGSLFEGRYENGQRKGHGKLTDKEGVVLYEGEWDTIGDNYNCAVCSTRIHSYFDTLYLCAVCPGVGFCEACFRNSVQLAARARQSVEAKAMADTDTDTNTDTDTDTDTGMLSPYANNTGIASGTGTATGDRQDQRARPALTVDVDEANLRRHECLFPRPRGWDDSLAQCCCCCCCCGVTATPGTACQPQCQCIGGCRKTHRMTHDVWLFLNAANLSQAELINTSVLIDSYF